MVTLLGITTRSNSSSYASNMSSTRIKPGSTGYHILLTDGSSMLKEKKMVGVDGNYLGYNYEQYWAKCHCDILKTCTCSALFLARHNAGNDNILEGDLLFNRIRCHKG